MNKTTDLQWLGPESLSLRAGCARLAAQAPSGRAVAVAQRPSEKRIETILNTRTGWPFSRAGS